MIPSLKFLRQFLLTLLFSSFLAKLIFQGWMYSNDPIAMWKDYAFNSDIKPRVLLQFAVIYWLNKKSGAPLEIELINFVKLLHAICSIAGKLINFLFVNNLLIKMN